MFEVDADNSGYIDYSEFVMASTRKDLLLQRQYLEEAFKVFDTDNSGTITASELKTVFEEHIDEGEDVWQELISLVDQDGNEEIDLREFKEMMLNIF